jgi:hypothetical protein
VVLGALELTDLKFFLSFIFLVSFSLEASAKKARSLSKGQSKSIIVLEMAKTTNVYKSPNFDAKVLLRLESGRKVMGTRKTVQGTDGFGLFHKVRLRKGVYGYIVDTDIEGFEPSGIFSNTKKKSGGLFSRRSRNSNQPVSPTRSKSFGLTYAYMDYSIAASDQTLSSGASLFGFKMTGPWFSPGLPLDVSLLISPGAPSLLDRVSSSAEGFFGFLDVSYQSVFRRGANSEMYWSLGPALSYYDFEIQFNGETEARNSSQMDIGFSAGLGWAYSLDDFVVRFEGRYLRTNESQLTGLISFQRYF